MVGLDDVLLFDNEINMLFYAHVAVLPLLAVPLLAMLARRWRTPNDAAEAPGDLGEPLASDPRASPATQP